MELVDYNNESKDMSIDEILANITHTPLIIPVTPSNEISYKPKVILQEAV